MKVTGIAEDGLIVSSWGKRMKIPFSDILESGAVRLIAETYMIKKSKLEQFIGRKNK